MAIDAWKIDRANDAAVAERVPVSVLVVGLRQVPVVGHEGDRVLVRPEGGPGQAQTVGGVLERRSHGVPPGPALARVVNLVQNRERAPDQRAERTRVRGDLLIRDDDAVHVRRQRAVAGRPSVIEVQAERLGGVCPLPLQVLGGNHDDHPVRPSRDEGAADRGQREGRLPGAGRRDGEEAATLAALELLQGLELPGTKARQTSRDPAASVGGIRRTSQDRHV